MSRDMAYKNTNNYRWCDLPPELLDVVGKCLDVPSDTWHMRSVCSSWRLAVPTHPGRAVQFPAGDSIKFLGSNDLDMDVDNNVVDVRLGKHTFFHLCPPSGLAGPGWLIKTEEHKPGSFHLFNPFSRTRTHLIEAFNLDLTNIKVRELGSEYVLHNNGSTNIEDFNSYNMEHEKVALLYFPAAPSTCHHHHHECKSTTRHSSSSYALLSTHNTGKLLLYQSTLKRWSFLDDFTLGYDDRSIFVNDWSLHYVDVVEHHGTFYAVTNSGRTVAINLHQVAATEDTLSPVSVTLLTKSIIGGDKKCLVKSADDLLMVDIYTCPTPGARLVKVHAVEIFKLDRQQHTWVLVKTLGDRALFLSNHSSFSASASAFPGCTPNSIYFHFKAFDKDSCCCETGKNDEFMSTRDDIGVFDFEKGILGSLQEYLQDSQLFSWPPPAWVTLSPYHH